MDKRRTYADLAKKTLQISQDGTYNVDNKTVNISEKIAYTNKNSEFIPQSKADSLESCFAIKHGKPDITLRNESTLAAILRYADKGRTLGVLNFASAKNPGGGFLNGAMAQEESLALASALYLSQLECPAYYETNRACKSMMYTDCAIWSPEVVFFRGDDGGLLKAPVNACVLTLPAVNFGQVLIKHENKAQAKLAMKRRMKIALAIFADKGCDTIILGAYGCGVFGNDPSDVSAWWKELIADYGGYFERIDFAVLERGKTSGVMGAFERVVGV